MLGEELEEQTDDDHGGDNVCERKKTEKRSSGSKGEEGDVGHSAFEVEAGENAEEVAIGGRGIRNARVPKEEGEDAAEGCDHDENRRELAEAMGHGGTEGGRIGLFHEQGDHGAACGKGLFEDEALPRKDGENGDIHGEVQNRHNEDREKDCTRDGSAGIADLSAEQRDVVVAPIVVGCNEHGGGKAGKEGGGEVEGSGRKLYRLGEVAVEKGGEHDPGDGSEHDDQHGNGERADAGEAAV